MRFWEAFNSESDSMIRNLTLVSSPVSVFCGGPGPSLPSASRLPYPACTNSSEVGREGGGIEIRKLCPLCGGKVVRQLKLSHTVVCRCRAKNCGLEFATPQLDDRELAHLYSTLYYPATGDSRQIRREREGTPDSVLRQVLPQLEATLGALKGLRLLDYGCGRGPLSRIALDFGLDPVGIEPDPVARSIAAGRVGMPVYASVAELCSKYPAAQFELIILWNVIEHLRTPWSELREMSRLLRPRGRLLVCTMNTRCIRARIERGRWISYEDPTHFYYFDRRSLERVLRSSGFQRVQEWKPKIHYPHHDTLRRCFYGVSTAFGVSDGLYYLCSTAVEDA
jgi:SAM-dependent methyltransferase